MNEGLINYVVNTLRYKLFNSLPNPFMDREVSELVYDALNLTQALNSYSYDPVDTGRETYLEEKQKFKKKWFDTPRKDRIQETIDKVLAEAKTELYETYGIKEDANNET